MEFEPGDGVLVLYRVRVTGAGAGMRDGNNLHFFGNNFPVEAKRECHQMMRFGHRLNRTRLVPPRGSRAIMGKLWLRSWCSRLSLMGKSVVLAP